MHARFPARRPDRIAQSRMVILAPWQNALFRKGWSLFSVRIRYPVNADISNEIPQDFIRGRRTDGQKTLAQIEGRHYEEMTIRVPDRKGNEVDAITFLLKKEEAEYGLWTSAEYVGHIVKGLRAHQVPEE